MARYANKKAVNEDIAVKALTTADTVWEDPTSVMVANAIGIVTDLVKTICSEVKDETLSTHHVFCTVTGSAGTVREDPTSFGRLMAKAEQATGPEWVLM